MTRDRLRTSALLALVISALIVGCSDEEDDVLSGMKRPSSPEYAMGVVKNERVQFKFEFTETAPGFNNNRIVVSEDTITYILTTFYDSDSLERSENYFILTFSWNERSQEIYNAGVWLVYNMDGIRYKVNYSFLTTIELNGKTEYVTSTTIADVDLRISRFSRDADKKKLSFDFIMHPHADRSNLEFETTITGSVKVNYRDYP